MSEDEDATSLQISDFETQFIPQEDDEEALWEVLEITAERGNRYRVKWAGIDPKTGKPWAQSWVPKHDCTNDLVEQWKREKAKKKKDVEKEEAGPSTRERGSASTTSTARRSTRASNTASLPPDSAIASAPPDSRRSRSTRRSSVRNRSKRKSPDRDLLAEDDDATDEMPRPQKKRRVEPVDEEDEPSYEVAKVKKFGKVLTKEEDDSMEQEWLTDYGPDDPPRRPSSKAGANSKGKEKEKRSVSRLQVVVQVSPRAKVGPPRGAKKLTETDKSRKSDVATAKEPKVAASRTSSSSKTPGSQSGSRTQAKSNGKKRSREDKDGLSETDTDEDRRPVPRSERLSDKKAKSSSVHNTPTERESVTRGRNIKGRFAPTNGTTSSTSNGKTKETTGSVEQRKLFLREEEEEESQVINASTDLAPILSPKSRRNRREDERLQKHGDFLDVDSAPQVDGEGVGDPEDNVDAYSFEDGHTELRDDFAFPDQHDQGISDRESEEDLDLGPPTKAPRGSAGAPRRSLIQTRRAPRDSFRVVPETQPSLRDYDFGTPIGPTTPSRVPADKQAGTSGRRSSAPRMRSGNALTPHTVHGEQGGSPKAVASPTPAPKRPLRSIPIMSPSKFKPFLRSRAPPDDEPPVSSIEQFSSPERGKSKKGVEGDSIISSRKSAEGTASKRRRPVQADNVSSKNRTRRLSEIMSGGKARGSHRHVPSDGHEIEQDHDAIVEEMENAYVDYSSGAIADYDMDSVPNQFDGSLVDAENAKRQHGVDEAITGGGRQSVLPANRPDSHGTRFAPNSPRSPPRADAEELPPTASPKHASSGENSQSQQEQGQTLNESDLQEQLTSAFHLLHTKSEEISRLEAELELARQELTHVRIEQGRKMDAAVKELTESHTVLLEKWREERQRDEKETNEREEALRSELKEHEEEWQKKTKIQEEESMKNEERWKGAKRDAELDRDLFREQYGKASEYVSVVTAENDELTTRVEIAESQVSSGLELIRSTYQVRIDKLQSELGKSKGAIGILEERERRIQGSEVARKASEWEERGHEVEKLTSECESLDKENNYLHGQVAFYRREAELLRQQLSGRVSPVELSGQKGDENEPGRIWDDDEDGEWVPDKSEPSGSSSSEAEEEEVQSRGREDVAVRRNERQGEDEDNAPGEEMVYMCRWAVDGATERCTALVKTREELRQHFITDGHWDAM